ncbi:hypothetical protein DKX38_007032 [Salix brachista]|uniref:Uncharacterized protein n=1 Tax=Salix brachista TaxID=2182728 RepID=A0A5N5MNZ7_9ROSI|nr:hypothetical protein DKX38_007032 [Salix brachista]
MKMVNLENMMKLPTMVLFEEVMSGGTVKLILEGKGSGLQGVPWKDFSRSGLNDGKADGLRVENLFSKQTDHSEPVRKSKWVPKKRLLDDDDEIRFLEKVKTSKISANHGAGFGDEEGGRY